MEIYVGCITLLAVIALLAVMLLAWRRPERKVMAMLAELVLDSHERLMAADSSSQGEGKMPDGAFSSKSTREYLPRKFAADLAAAHARSERGRPSTMADGLDAQTQVENEVEVDQPVERGRF